MSGLSSAKAKGSKPRIPVQRQCLAELETFLQNYQHDWKKRLQDINVAIPDYELIKHLIIDAHLETKYLQMLYPEEFRNDILHASS